MKKILLLALIMIGSIAGAQAQKVYTGENDIYGIGSAPTFKKHVLGVTVGIAKEVEVGVRYQRNLSRYFALDVIGVNYAYDFSPSDEKYNNRHELELNTGIRCYSPQIWKFKIYAGLNTGFQYSINEYDYTYGNGKVEVESHSSCHMSSNIQVGFVFGKFTIGYQASRTHFGDHKRHNHTDHLLKIGIEL